MLHFLKKLALDILLCDAKQAIQVDSLKIFSRVPTHLKKTEIPWLFPDFSLTKQCFSLTCTQSKALLSWLQILLEVLQFQFPFFSSGGLRIKITGFCKLKMHNLISFHTLQILSFSTDFSFFCNRSMFLPSLIAFLLKQEDSYCFSFPPP